MRWIEKVLTGRRAPKFLMQKIHRFGLSIGVWIVIGCGALCWHLQPIHSEYSSRARTSKEEEQALELKYRVREIQPPPLQAEPGLPPVEQLDPVRTRHLLDRLPPETPLDPKTETVLVSEKALPLPVSATVVKTEFSSGITLERPDTTPTGPLEVERVSPRGAVEFSRSLTVHFSQPMAALSGLADMQTIQSVVKLEPQPPGRWRWVGTQTLIFEPEAGRFPMATLFQATIPAGVRSVTGHQLEQPTEWTFQTPPLQVKTSFPTQAATSFQPVVLLEFDQRIDPQAVLRSLSLEAGNQPFAVQVVTPEQLAQDEDVSQRVESATPGRWIAVQPVNSLPVDSKITVRLKRGAPSAEGPLETTRDATFSFKTPGRLRLVSHPCHEASDCPPSNWLPFEFSNELDEKAFTPDMATVTPKPANLEVSVSGSSVVFNGDFQANTGYTFRFSANLVDRFGQTLGKPRNIKLNFGNPEAFLYSPYSDLVVLDPAGKRRCDISSQGIPKLRARLFQVQPEDWPDYKWYRSTQLDEINGSKTIAPPGKLIFDRTIPIHQPEASENTLTEIDVNPGLVNGIGHVVLVVEPVGVQLTSDVKPEIIWFQATNLAVDVIADEDGLLVWANSLIDGQPIASATVTLFPPRRSGLTDHQGLATISYQDQSQTEDPFVILRQGDDTVLLSVHSNRWQWGATYTALGNREEGSRWFVFDDRGLYQPGEELHFKGWIRRYDPAKGGDITRGHNPGKTVAYQIFDGQQRMIAYGTTQLNVFGGFDAAVTLPTSASLGRATIHFRRGSTFAEVEQPEYQHSFEIQQFRRPEYELKLTASQGPHLVGTSATATISASYFAGGPLKKADTRWKFSVMEGSYHPPNWGEFRFGKQSSSWWRSSANNQTCTGSTDVQGRHTVQIDFDGINQPGPVVVTAEATISDVNRQQQSASTSILVHPASLVVGLKQRQGFIFPGESFALESMVTDLDGTPQAGKIIRLEIVRQEWRFEDGAWTQLEVDPQTTTILSAATPVTWEFSPIQSGEYQLTATVADDQNRLHQTVVSVWVAGSTQGRLPEFEEEDVKLISNRTEYAPGETAELLLQAPFFPAEGLLTIQRSGVIHHERFTLDQPARLFKIPIDESQIPNITLQVNLVGEVFRRDETGAEVTSVPKQPAYASGTVELAVSTQSRRLTVTAKPVAEHVAPGSQTSIEIDVTDAAGKPVAESECAVVVVDEAILALIARRFPVDPLEVIYQKREAGTFTRRSRDWFQLASLEEVTGAPRQAVAFRPPSRGAAGAGGSLAGGDEGGWLLSEAFPIDENPLEDSRWGKTSPTASQKNSQPPIRLRTHFSPLAAFSPSVVTNNQGRATVEIELPDNLTRYRILVFAAAGDNLFGKGESVLTTRLLLMVRPSAPRFLNLGDQFQLPVVIQNQEAEPLAVEVAVRSQYLSFPEGAGRRVIVPANDRREVRIPAAPARIGPAIIDVAASAGNESDGAQAKLKIYTSATLETTAVYGEVTGSAVQLPVSLPEGTLPKSGKLELTLSSTQLQSLTDAAVYLANYPFDCSEQIASRMIGLVALNDVLGQFKGISNLPQPAQFEAFFQADLNRLRSRQNADGGFSFWTKDGNSDPFLSVHVAHALIRAKQQGLVNLSDNLVRNAAAYVQNIEHAFPNFYPPDARQAVRAYALYVRHFNGDTNPLAAQQLIEERDLSALRLETIGWVLPVLAASDQTRGECQRLIQHLSNRVTETNAEAGFVESITDDEHLLLHSNRRTDAIVLGALLVVKPESDLIPKLVRGLLAHKTQGRWANTQENAFVLLALDRYVSMHETVTPDFVARLWLGEDFAGAHSFQGRTTGPHQLSIPFDTLGTVSQSKPITLSKTGPGRLYYRLGLEYGLDALKTQAVDAGFAISRLYQAVDNPDDVQRLGPNEWQIRAGARVQVTVTMVVPSRRHHVALVDPLPAGFEILNPVFKTTGTLNWQAVQTMKNNTGSDWNWFDHQNLRDNCAQAFASQVQEGVY
ncbi:MAG: hypothetical protein HY774_07940 [Acidobacteria bacterium]|nr:hypothetical protein [Acidobacteriota bacterium]